MDVKKYTLITGASGGIGYDLARLAGADGRNLILVARSAQKLNLFASELEKINNIEVITILCPIDSSSFHAFSQTINGIAVCLLIWNACLRT